MQHPDVPHGLHVNYNLFRNNGIGALSIFNGINTLVEYSTLYDSNSNSAPVEGNRVFRLHALVKIIEIR
jgi:hypothetical protein